MSRLFLCHCVRDRESANLSVGNQTGVLVEGGSWEGMCVAWTDWMNGCKKLSRILELYHMSGVFVCVCMGVFSVCPCCFEHFNICTEISCSFSFFLAFLSFSSSLIKSAARF